MLNMSYLTNHLINKKWSTVSKVVNRLHKMVQSKTGYINACHSVSWSLWVARRAKTHRSDARVPKTHNIVHRFNCIS
jgi:hypothetical protein